MIIRTLVNNVYIDRYERTPEEYAAMTRRADARQHNHAVSPLMLPPDPRPLPLSTVRPEPIPDPEPTTFAGYLRQGLRKRGMTQEALARCVGCSVPQVSKWVTGVARPYPDNLRRVCGVLGLDAELAERLMERRDARRQWNGGISK